MKKLFLVSLMVLAAINTTSAGCEWITRETMRKVEERLMIQGKGATEISDILEVRLHFCRDTECPSKGKSDEKLCFYMVK